METIYTSKKHPDVTAKIVKKPNETTVILEYLTGDEVGKTATITTGTLQRYWRKGEGKSTADVLNVDMNEVNEPYPEPKEKKYIPKPESVKEYEAKKRRSYNDDLASFDRIVEELGHVSAKVNSGFIKLRDSQTTIWRKNAWIDIYADEKVWTALTNAGFTSTENKDKDRPYHIRVNNNDEFAKVVDTLANLLSGGEK